MAEARAASAFFFFVPNRGHFKRSFACGEVRICEWKERYIGDLGRPLPPQYQTIGCLCAPSTAVISFSTADTRNAANSSSALLQLLGRQRGPSPKHFEGGIPLRSTRKCYRFRLWSPAPNTLPQPSPFCAERFRARGVVGNAPPSSSVPETALCQGVIGWIQGQPHRWRAARRRKCHHDGRRLRCAPKIPLGGRR